MSSSSFDGHLTRPSSPDILLSILSRFDDVGLDLLCTHSSLYFKSKVLCQKQMHSIDQRPLPYLVARDKITIDNRSKSFISIARIISRKGRQRIGTSLHLIELQSHHSLRCDAQVYTQKYALTLSHRSSMQLHDIYRPQCGGKCVCLHP